MSTAPAVSIIPVEKWQLGRCRDCNEPVAWQQSQRTGGKYPTDVFSLDGHSVTRRNAFHRCDQAKKDLWKRLQAEQGGQLSLTLQVVEPAKYEPQGTSQAAQQRAMKAFLDAATEPQIRQALVTMFNRQTSMEQSVDSTFESNGVGFSANDADILSDICKKAQKYNGLRGGQIPLVRKKMKKYARQLVAALARGEWKI
jgi:hypothetical protein